MKGDRVIIAFGVVWVVTALVLAALDVVEPWSATAAVFGIIVVGTIGRATADHKRDHVNRP
jgi:hypothetical protein